VDEAGFEFAARWTSSNKMQKMPVEPVELTRGVVLA
jgi:hypothetical protein